jgi:demethylmenaquinone methyltransferase/2-methoxy-6-polyprenyl-1,4-benzoquinol methylase
MLRLAHRKMARQRLTRHIQIVRADSLAVPLPSACASVVCMAFGLRNLDDPGAGVAEMVRLAAPDGGRVAILEAHAPPPGILGGLASGYRRVMMPRLARLVAGGNAQAYRYLASSSATFAPASTIGDLLRKHGLEDVRTRTFAGGIVSLVTGRRA